MLKLLLPRGDDRRSPAPRTAAERWGFGHSRILVASVALCSLGVANAPSRAELAARATLTATSSRPEDARVLELRGECEKFLALQHAVGMGVAILDDGKVVLDAAFGFADRETKRAASTDTLYRLGSISKPVAAAIAMQLVDEKKLDLDADVRAQLPGVAARMQPTTLRQLLSHTAGIRHYLDGRKDNSTEHKTTAQALELFVGDPLVAPPGTLYSYSTHGYTLVHAVLEAASKKSFVELVRERIRARGLASLDCEVLTEPAKPARTALYELDEKPAGAAEETSAVREAKLCGPREDNSWKYAGGGMESTVLDLARFGELVRTAKLVSESARDALWTRTKLNDGKEIAYGLGWRISPDGSVVLHTGSQQGAQSVLLVVPGAGLVIAVMTNTSGTKPLELASKLQQQLAPVSAPAPTGK